MAKRKQPVKKPPSKAAKPKTGQRVIKSRKKPATRTPVVRRPAAAARQTKKPPSILADDIPDRVQADYRRLLSQGVRDRDVTGQLEKDWKKLLATKALKEEFWLALAGTQWQLGRLEPAVKKRALGIIDGVVKPLRKGKSADGESAARRKALTSLRGILTSPQPAKKDVRPDKAPSSDIEAWPVGEVFSYKLMSGRYVLFHVVACLGDKATGYWPVFALLDWIGIDMPAAAAIQSLPLRTDPHSPSEAVWMVSVIKRHPSDFSPDRIDWLHVTREPHARNIDRGFAITYWKDKLDEKLRFDFGWE